MVTLSRNARVIAVDKLPKSFFDRLVAEQHELIEQLLMVPMGSSRWGGSAYDLARVEAADQGQRRGA